MGTIALFETGEQIAADLQSADLNAQGPVREITSLDHLRELVAGESPDVVVLGPECHDPVAVGQLLHSIRRDVPLLICPEPGRERAIRNAVRFSPFLPLDIRCVAAQDRGELVRELRSIAERSRQRVKHNAAVRNANTILATAAPRTARSLPYLDRMLEAAPIGIITAGADGRTRSSNARALSMLDLDSDRALNTIIRDRFDDPAAFDALIRSDRNGNGTSASALVSRTVADDPPRYFQITAAPYESATLETEFLLMIEDVTGRVRAEQQREHLLAREREARAELDGIAANLFESERSLRLALQAGRLGIWRWDEYSNIVRWSDSLERIYGLEPGGFSGTFDAFLGFVHPEDREYVLDRVSRAGESGPNYEIEFRIVRADGAERWIADRGQVLFDDRGKRCGITGVCWDSTEERLRDAERDRLTAELEAAHSLLDTVFENAPIGLGYWGRDLRYVKVNRALAEINGIAAEAHTGKTVSELLPGVDSVVSEAIRHVAETGQAVLNQEAQGVTPAHPGVTRHWNVSYYPIRLGGEISGIGAVCEDITERKQTEQRITELLAREVQARSEAESAERRAAFLADAAAVLGSSLDFEGNLSAVARLAVRQFADWCAIDVLDVSGAPKRVAEEPGADQHSRPEIGEPLRRVLDTGRPEWASAVGGSYVIVPILSADWVLGAISLIAEALAPSFGSADVRVAEQLAGRAALAIQNSRLYAQAEERRAEAERTLRELQRVNRELEEFAYVASHDLQEPLRTVASYTQLIEREYRGRLDETAHEYIGRVITAVTRMRDLIRDLLDYSRVSSADEGPAERVQMEQVLFDATEALRAAIDESGAVITRDPLPEVEQADRAQMDQLMLNLLSNAIKYRRPGVTPVIHVGAVAIPGAWEFAVRDNGQGFKPELADHLFRIFKRLHGKEVPGTGIGLALCRRIVERHGGTIRAEGHPNQGATFTFTLPRMS